MVELGCGVGACGLCVCPLAAHTLLTDGNDATLQLARENLDLNAERACGRAEGVCVWVCVWVLVCEYAVAWRVLLCV
jgi:16S rRNA G1207 methylase RsmC